MVFRSSNVRPWTALGMVIDPCCTRSSPSDSIAIKENPPQFQVFLTNAYLTWIWFWETPWNLAPNLCDAIFSVFCETAAAIFMRQVKGKKGYPLCVRFIQRELYCGKRVTFPCFKCKNAVAIHFVPGGVLNIISASVPLSPYPPFFLVDYMHLVFLVVINKLSALWLH